MISSFQTSKVLDDLSNYVNDWNQAKKKLILIGGMNPNNIEQLYLDVLGNDSSVVVMTEVTSNVHQPNFITNIDTIITPFSHEDFLDFQPEILVTFGGMIVSKRIKAFLRKYQPKQHWHIDELRAYDTFGCLTKHFEVSPNSFLEPFLHQIQKVESDYLSKTLQVRNHRTTMHDAYLCKIPFSDLKVLKLFCRN